MVLRIGLRRLRGEGLARSLLLARLYERARSIQAIDERLTQTRYAFEFEDFEDQHRTNDEFDESKPT